MSQRRRKSPKCALSSRLVVCLLFVVAALPEKTKTGFAGNNNNKVSVGLTQRVMGKLIPNHNSFMLRGRRKEDPDTELVREKQTLNFRDMNALDCIAN